MAGHRLVHRIVDHLREEMVQRLFVGAADIHAGAAAHRLQALQHFDGAGVIGVACILRRRFPSRLSDRIGGAGRAWGRLGHARKQVVAVIHA